MLKGSVLGPMVLCGICFIRSRLNFLSEIGVKDSKKLTPKRRSELANILKNNCYSLNIKVISSQEIDERQHKKITLNRLEEVKMAEIVSDLKPDIVFIDAADVNEQRFGKSIEKLLNYKPKKIVSKHKADDLYPIVSASSIVAKDKRDALIEELHKNYGNFGSGYPSDVKTIEFLRKYIKTKKMAPKFARLSWETTKKIIDEELFNKKITDFFN